ncbi:MAG: FAD-dependent oxidoreductase, partial [bacterium]|nr:FAD-dependent oxidoreductase [bacterium]
MRHTLIIGAGASGMAAAIAAAKGGERVTVIDRNRKPMKKLAVTGNGRGNLLNCGTPDFYGDRDFGME